LCLAGDIAAFKEPTVAVNTTHSNKNLPATKYDKRSCINHQADNSWLTDEVKVALSEP
jgi:hypothetical protein